MHLSAKIVMILVKYSISLRAGSGRTWVPSWF